MLGADLGLEEASRWTLCSTTSSRFSIATLRVFDVLRLAALGHELLALADEPAELRRPASGSRRRACPPLPLSAASVVAPRWSPRRRRRRGAPRSRRRSAARRGRGRTATARSSEKTASRTSRSPVSISLAIATSSSRVRSGTPPISWRYMRTGSAVSPGARSTSSASGGLLGRPVGLGRLLRRLLGERGLLDASRPRCPCRRASRRPGRALRLRPARRSPRAAPRPRGPTAWAPASRPGRGPSSRGLAFPCASRVRRSGGRPSARAIRDRA